MDNMCFLVESKLINNIKKDKPSVRQSSSVILYKYEESEKIIVFGGYSNKKYLNDLFEYDISENKWTIIAKNAPKGRIWNGCIFLEKDYKMIILGGEGDNEIELNDVYEYNIITKEWRELGYLNIGGYSCFSSVYRKKNNSIILFGGNINKIKNNFLWEYNIDNNSLSKIKYNQKDDEIPCSRYNHSSVILEDEDKMYIFGGKSGDIRLSDLWCFNFNNMKWNKVITKGNKPFQKASCSLIMLPNRKQMILFGGYNGKKALNKLYIFDFEESRWKRLMIYGDVPIPQSNSSIVCSSDKYNNFTLYLFAGVTTFSTVHNNLYQISFKQVKDNNGYILNDNVFYVKNSIILSEKTDIELISNDGLKIYVHKKILMKNSNYFSILLSGNYSDSKNKSIYLENIDGKILRFIIEYMYNIPFSINLSEEKDIIKLIIDIFYTANFLMYYKLKSDCIDKLSKRITIYNLPKIIQFANDMNITELKNNIKREINYTYSKSEICNNLFNFYIN